MEIHGPRPATQWIRFLRLAAIGAIHLLLLIGLARVVENHRGAEAWAAYKALLAKDGLTLPDLPANLAGNSLPDRLLCELPDIGPLPDPPARWQLQQREASRQRAARWRHALWHPELQEISKAAATPDALPLIGAPFLQLGQLYQLRALVSLNEGVPDKACADLVTLFRLARHTESVPLLTSAEMEATLLNLIFQPLWEGLATRQWPESCLETLQRHLEAFDLLAQWPRIAQGEHLRSVQTIEQLAPRAVFGHRLWNELLPKGWIYQNGITARSFFESLMPLAVQPVNQTAVPHLADALDYNTAQLFSYHPYRFLVPKLLPRLAPTLEKMAFTQATLRQAALACALERYRLHHQGYPESLRQLIPRYLASFPVDPVTGGPMRYLPTDDGGYRVYSVGWNGVDDGGQLGPAPSVDSRLHGNRPADWVWVMPGALPEERRFVQNGTP